MESAEAVDRAPTVESVDALDRAMAVAAAEAVGLGPGAERGRGVDAGETVESGGSVEPTDTMEPRGNVSPSETVESGGNVEPARPAQAVDRAGAERSVEGPVEQPGDSLRVGSGWDAPTWVMVRSFLVPGWGQAKNGAWLKALFCAAVGAAFYERLYFEDRMVSEYREKMHAAEDPYLASVLAGKVERHRGHRRDFIWWTGLFLALCGG
ncbi:MAG: hypothetical protein GF330_03190, partial [Candidatus Eisenbacteria bacterium]|nr:hypothetical protein [Candidatus Eisenbacteria bacterium]